MVITYISLLVCCLVGITCVIINQINLIQRMNKIIRQQETVRLLQEHLQQDLEELK